VTPEQRTRAVVFNAAAQALSINGHWVRLGIRQAIADEVLAALDGAGLVVVSAEDLAAVIRDRYSVEGHQAAVRLRAALPERTTDG
jgi:uncharacterized membrane protein